jgi:hypothetical protein
VSLLQLAVLGIQLAIRCIELRLEHYKVKPELREQDAEAALEAGRLGKLLYKAILTVGDNLPEPEEPAPPAEPPPNA